VVDVYFATASAISRAPEFIPPLLQGCHILYVIVQLAAKRIVTSTEPVF